MAYSPRELSVLAYANGFTLWHYRSADSASAITGQDYFAGAADMLRDGDLILANHAISGGGTGASLMRVSASPRGTPKAVTLGGGKAG
jgi:hypothetical protein